MIPNVIHSKTLRLIKGLLRTVVQSYLDTRNDLGISYDFTDDNSD